MNKPITPPQPGCLPSVGNERYESLDGLRAYAAIGIILMHVQANMAVKPSENYLTGTIIPFFTDFTLLFMLVSAFSMCCGYYGRVKAGAITPGAFYQKRYLRILPFFALLNLLNLVLEPTADTLQQVYANLTLGFNLLPDNEIHVIGVGWFLGIIFVFYMLFPFFVFLIDNKRRAWLSLVVATGLLFIAFTRFGHPTRQNIVFCMPYFLVGGIIYLYRTRLAVWVNRSRALSALVAVAVVAGCFASLQNIKGDYLHYGAELLMFASLLAYALGGKNAVLGNKVVHYISGISMEVYLCHMVIYRVVEKVRLEQYIHDGNMLYIVTCIGVAGGAIVFAHVCKNYLVDRLVNFIIKR